MRYFQIYECDIILKINWSRSFPRFASIFQFGNKNLEKLKDKFYSKEVYENILSTRF